MYGFIYYFVWQLVSLSPLRSPLAARGPRGRAHENTDRDREKFYHLRLYRVTALYIQGFILTGLRLYTGNCKVWPGPGLAGARGAPAHTGKHTQVTYITATAYRPQTPERRGFRLLSSVFAAFPAAERKSFSHNYRTNSYTRQQRNTHTRETNRNGTARLSTPLSRVTRSAHTSSNGLLENTSPTHSTLIFSIRIQVHPGAVPRLELGDEFLL